MTSNNPPQNETPKLTLKERLAIFSGATLIGAGLLGISYWGSRYAFEDVARKGVFRVDFKLPDGYEIVQKTLDTVE